MAKSNQKSTTAAAAAAADTQMENGTIVVHEEPLTPPRAEPIADAGYSASEVLLRDPVEFIRDRVNSIELWRATVARLNMTQLGVSLVRGVLRRGRLAAPPMRVFDTEEKTASAEAKELVQPLHPSQPVPPLLHPHSALETNQVTAQMVQRDEARQTPVQEIDYAACQQMAHHTPNHRSTHLPLQPSVARRALVHTASRASVPLYIGMLTAFIGHGVASMYNADTETDSIGASGTAAERCVKEPTSVSGAVPSGLHTSGRHLRLTPEMNDALHEVHRAAAEVMYTIDHEAKEMHALATATLQLSGRAAAYVTDEDERAWDMRQAQLSRSCRRLSRVVANLYSLVSLLDFFAVENASLPAPTPDTAAAANAVSHASAGSAARERREAAVTVASGPGHASGNTSDDFICSSSASTVAATAMAEHSAQLTTVPPCAAGSSPSTTTAPPVFTKPAASAETPAHIYTTERFHGLFDASGPLPHSVWRVFAAAATTLSEFAVPWSLTTGDAQSRQAFNSAACAILGEDQRCLLLQLHRLCARFMVLRQRVYALHPVSPLHFKVKQMLEWSGLLNAEAPDAWSYNNGDIDRCDLHADPLHNTYARGLRWRVNSSNKLALGMVMACPYTPAARDAALRRMKEVSAFAPCGSTGCRAGAASDAGASAPLALLASLASAGTNGRPGAAFDGLATRPSSSTYAAPTQDSGAAALSHISPVPGYAGLWNDGNTCFLNSVVQLLGSAALFRDDLMARVQATVFCHSLHADHPSPTPANAQALATLFTKYGCRLAIALLLGELQWRGAQQHQRHAVRPDYLTPHLPPPFNDHRQHDASEFWHALMDKLDVPNQPGGAVVASWFSGRTTTTMTCVACQHRRLHSNTFWDLSIPLLRSTSAPSVPASGGSEAPTLTVMPTLPAVPVAAAGRVVSQVEVQHFAHATAVTTTYASSPASDLPLNTLTAADASSRLEAAERAEEEAAARVNNKTASTPHPIVTSSGAESHEAPLPPSPVVAADEAPKALQHLLLYLLHPALNKELLHGSNAVDCEHCHRRTNTEITTRLVAEEEVESEVGVSAIATGVHGEGVSAVLPARVSSGCGTGAGHEGAMRSSAAAATAWEADGETASPAPLAAGGRAPTRPLTSTAAGSGLPYYLALQLNRFAYRRVAHSYDKITDGVPLNEVVIVPVYPDPSESRPRPPSPDEAQRLNAPAVMVNEEDGDADTQREDSDRHGIPLVRAQARPGSAAPAVPVWVAYRLQSIIIHSGSTPSSGHYFTLTRRLVEAPAQVSINGTNPGEEGEHHASAAADLSSMRTYVEELGAALTGCLRTERHFSYAETAHSTACAGGAEGLGEDSSTRACVGGAWLQPPALSPAPMLPTTAVSVSGDRLYENWVMLNDSNVQTVHPDTMRRILHGCGGGVYSASETPYIILYEKVPVAYNGTTGSNALPEEEATVTHVADAALLVAARLRRMWVTRRASPGAFGIASADHTNSKPVKFAPEVLQIFRARLQDETARSAALSAASHVADGRVSASTAGNRTQWRPPPVGTVVDQGVSATPSRANVSRSSWPHAAVAGEGARPTAANAFVLGANTEAPVSSNDSNGSACRTSQSSRQRRRISTAKRGKVPRPRRYSANLNRQGWEEHHKHGDAALTSSGSDADSVADE
ncbi:hypothetical protein JIQ42_08321 [Leishmania sp. Namibia]|uniref:hypothetical protein n=1 Tax=Leishmania sp. Namibia TaxID=2802991 RepID=UPI001B448BD8|nr:hypothetical protein JIQ42_08321 [Leishmania sp. Namibia]